MEIEEYEAIRTQEDSIKLNDSDVKYTFAFEKGTFEDGTEITTFSYVSGGENRPVLFLTNGGLGSGVVLLQEIGRKAHDFSRWDERFFV